MVDADTMRDAKTLLILAIAIEEEYSALLKQATDKLTHALEMRLDARVMMENASVAQLKEVFG